MAHTTSSTATLTQRRVFAQAVGTRPPRFGVQEQVKPAVPASLLNAFVLMRATGTVDKERFVRVASKPELLTLPVNPLNHFKADGFDLGAVALNGDLLRIFNPPSEAQPSSGYTTQTDYLVAAADAPNQRLKIVDAFWYAQDGLAWELRRGVSVVASGLSGNIVREQDLGFGEFLCDRVALGFESASDAFDHLDAVQVAFDALVAAHNADAQAYLDADVNPVVNTYGE